MKQAVLKENLPQLLKDAAVRATHYLDGVAEREVLPQPDAVSRLSSLGGPLPEHPDSPANVLALLDEVGSPATVATAGPRYFGFVIGGALPVAVAANWLATAWDQCATVRVLSPVAAEIEDIVLGWIADLLDLPQGLGGAFVTGASQANLTALAAARHALLARAGWDFAAQGMYGAPPIKVVVSEEIHSTMVKALALLGFGRDTLIRVPVDDQGRIIASCLPELDERTLVCIQAGNVNSGSFDPAEEICARAHAAGAWVHVDGAIGLWTACAPNRAHLMKGFRDADSWSTDGHKWLNTPYDCGLALVRDPETLRAAMAISAAYIPAGPVREPSQYSPEFSRRARAVDVWAVMRSLGRSGLAELIEQSCSQAERIAALLADAGLTILNEVVINQVLVAAPTDELTDRLVAEVQASGDCWCGGTVWQGKKAMRIAISNWSTTMEDIDRSAAAMISAARRIGAI